jgi:hypothetical protein
MSYHKNIEHYDDSLENKMAADPLKNKKMLNKNNIEHCFYFHLVSLHVAHTHMQEIYSKEKQVMIRNVGSTNNCPFSIKTNSYQAV